MPLAWYESRADAHWGHGKGKEIVIHAEAPLSSIDVPTTLMLNMNHSLGRDEAEIRLKEKAKVYVSGFEVDGEFISVDNDKLQLTASFDRIGTKLAEGEKSLLSKLRRHFGEDEDDDVQNGFIEDKRLPEFFFGREGINDFQHSYKGSDKGIFDIGQHRSGHPYTFLPHRIKFYVERNGLPDFLHVISNRKSNALKAVYAEKGKDMIQLWSFVNIRQEPGWKAFEKAAHDAGYKIKDFSKGEIEDSHGYWLDEDVENLHGQYSNQLEYGKDSIWNNIKKTSNYLKKCQKLSEQKFTITESLSGTLRNFVVVNQQEMIPMISDFFQSHKSELSEKLKSELKNVLESGNIKYLDQYGSIPKFNKKNSSREFEVKLKFQQGYSEDSIRLIFNAFEYEVSDTLILEFSKIDFRSNIYKEDKSNSDLYITWLKERDKIQSAVDVAEAELKKITGDNKGSLTPDSIRATDEYKKVKGNFDRAFKMLRDFNGKSPKEFMRRSRKFKVEEMGSLMLPERLPNYRTLQGYPQKKKRMESSDPALVHLSKHMEEFMKNVVQLKHDKVDKISVLDKYYFPKSKSVAADIEVKYKDGDEHVYHIDFNGINFSWKDFGVNVDIGSDVEEAMVGFKAMMDEKVPHQELVKK
jgi:ElaB/YqjD/DUF883 family membrane-anchored ribosome-binding protein